jgi:hypothetical protein
MHGGFGITHSWFRPLCYHKDVNADNAEVLVRGITGMSAVSCERARSTGGLCGKDGKFFVEREHEPQPSKRRGFLARLFGGSA